MLTNYQLAVRNAEATRRLLGIKKEIKPSAHKPWSRSDAFEWTRPDYKYYTDAYRASQRK